MKDRIARHLQRWQNTVRYHRLRLAYERWRGRRVVHFLHIGKTAGTAIKHALGPANDDPHRRFYFVLNHQHHVTLQHVPSGDLAFLCIRDPVERFNSGFYSRKRKGRPRLNVEWSPGEARAFNRFATANDLAEALGSADPELAAAARDAMGEIQHLRTHLDFWVKDVAELRRPQSRVIAVLRQDRLGSDFREFCRVLGLGPEIALPGGGVESHRNDYSDKPQLSEPARANVRQWYSRDYDFVAAIEEMTVNGPMLRSDFT